MISPLTAIHFTWPPEHPEMTSHEIKNNEIPCLLRATGLLRFRVLMVDCDFNNCIMHVLRID